MFRILAFAFVTQATAFFICKQDVIDRGFCHQQDVKIAVNINCSANVNASLLVSVVKHLTSTVQNYNLECRARTGNALQCYGDGMTGTPNAINNTFDIFFTFNYTIYAGHYLRINASCNDTKEVKDILLKPCVSGFTSSATFYNTTTVTLRCDHLDFNFSNNTPMAIKEQAIKERGGNIHGSCLKNNSCTSDCKLLSDGMHCLVPYTSGKIYQCALDGAVYNITDIDTVLTPLTDTTTTTQRTTTTTVRPTGTTTQRTTVRTHGTSHKTTKSSQGSTTSLQSTGVNNMASIYVVCGLLIFFICKK